MSLKKARKHTKEIQIRTTVSVEPSGYRREGDIYPLVCQGTFLFGSGSRRGWHLERALAEGVR